MGLFNFFKRGDAETRSRKSPGKVRMFNAASGDRLNASWTSSVQSADQMVYEGLETLRARARDQFANNDYVQRFAGLCRNNVIGHEGINIKSKVVDFKQRPDELVREAVNASWQMFTETEQYGTDLIDLEGLIINSLVYDGESFVITHYNRENVIGYELADATLCDVKLNKTHPNGNLIRFGIEYDDSNTPVNYYFKKASSNAVGMSDSDRYLIISADRVRHIFIKDWAGQRRGIPWVATGLQRLKMLTAFEDAALVAARIGASKMGFFTSPEGENYDGESNDDGDIVMNVEPGTFEDIGQRSFQAFDPDYPKGEFGEFTSACLRGVSAGLNIDHHSISNDMRSVNYSSARIAQLETRETWKALQGWFIRKVMKPIYREWLSHYYDFGRITIPSRNGSPKALNRPLAYYQPAVFTGRRWDWVDPQKEVNAKKTAIELGITSRSAVIRERGEDPDLVFKEIQEEQERMKALGLTTATEQPNVESEGNDTDEDE